MKEPPIPSFLVIYVVQNLTRDHSCIGTAECGAFRAFADIGMDRIRTTRGRSSTRTRTLLERNVRTVKCMLWDLWSLFTSASKVPCIYIQNEAENYIGDHSLCSQNTELSRVVLLFSLLQRYQACEARV
jgi:hypothetical protein